MATTPAPSAGLTNNQLYGLGIGANLVNISQAASAQRAMMGLQTQQLKDQIAFSRKILEQQKALRLEEAARQQIMARAAGDAFAASKAQFNNVEGDIGSKANTITDSFLASLAKGGPESVAPGAKGPAAELEAALRAKQTAGITDEATKLAAAQAFGKTMTDKGYALNEQGTLAGLLRNFGQGSQQASNSEIASREGRLYQPQVVQPPKSILGDVLFGAGSLALANQNKPAAPESPYALTLPQSNQFGLKPGAGIGFDPNASSGLGLRISGTRTIGG